MTLDDFDQFSTIVVGMAEMYGKQMGQPGIKMYWAVLHKNWELGDFAAAAGDLCASCEFMPTARDFEALRNKGKLTAGEAWEIARKACGSAIQLGHITNNGSCGDAFIDRVVRAMGGYGQIAMAREDQMTFLEKRFGEHYETMMDAEDTRQRLPKITAQAAGAGTGKAIGHSARGQPVRAAELLPSALLRKQAE